MDKREEEKLILEYFRNNFPNFPKGKLVKSESPDFILKFGRKKTIGIELTQLDQEAEFLKEKIEVSLLKKNEKVFLYQRKKFKEIWLIIHTDFVEDSKSYHIQNKLDHWQFSSSFDQVYLFDLFKKKIYQINH